VRNRLNLDQAEMVEQLQRWRHRLPRDVVIQTEADVAHLALLPPPIARSIAANTRRALRGSAA
jgi:hypothetical protein